MNWPPSKLLYSKFALDMQYYINMNGQISPLEYLFSAEQTYSAGL